MNPFAAPYRPTAMACAAALLCASAPALAQQQPEADTPDAVQTVVVTADRRAESIKRVPASVTAISGKTLEQIGAARIDDFVGLVPGLNFVGSRPGNRQLILRGISSGGDQQSASVGTYIDDVPVGSSTSLAVGSRIKPDVDAFDLERVEVLRGPQGTLYGANTIGGLLKYVTAQPDPSAFSGAVRAEYIASDGGGKGYGANAGINVPVSATAALRISAFDRQEPGYIENVAPVIGRREVNELRSHGGRISFAMKPADGFNLRATAMTQQFSTDGEATVDIAPRTGQPVLGENQQLRYTPEPSSQQFNLYSLSMDWQIGGGTLLSVTSYNTLNYDKSNDWTVLDGFGYNAPSVQLATEPDHFRTKKTTQELRYTSPKSDQFEWMAGAFWTREKGDVLQREIGLTNLTTVAPAPYDNLYTAVNDSTYIQRAAYANARYYFSPRADLAFGLRTTRESTSSDSSGSGLFNSGASHLDQSARFTSFMLAPRFLLSRSTTLYARAASASRPGGANSLTSVALAAGAQQLIRPDKLTSYELGAKTTLLGGRFGLDVSLFYIDWKDIQIRSTVGTFAFVGNGGKAKSQGAEVTMTARPLQDLALTLNGSYTDAKLVDNAPAVGGLAGEQLPNSAKFNASAGADYSFGGWNGGESYVGASLRHVGSRFENFVRGRSRDRLELPEFTTLDLRAGMRWDTWDVNVYLKNATNERVIETVTTNFTPSTASIGRPRTAGMFLTRRF